MIRCCLLLLGLCALFWHLPARASGDYRCDPEWKLSHVSMSGCDDMALLGPGNDTRVNLILLMLDLRGGIAPDQDPLRGWIATRDPWVAEPAPSDSSYADGEGSRCRSNDSGAAAFEAAVAAARGIPAGERSALVAARRALRPDCTGPAGGLPDLAAIRSRGGKAFAQYLLGAAAFYDGDFENAAAQFAPIEGSDQPWVSETACYMLGRVAVNRAQVGAFDDYGYPAQVGKVDAGLVGGAEVALQRYIRQYPQGRYAGSAVGLLRRVYWLGGDHAKLMPLYHAAFARGTDLAALAEEVDDKLLPDLKPEQTSDPVLLAVIDLMRMRGPGRYDDAASAPPRISLAEIEVQKPHFAGKEALFDYLRAAHAWFVAQDPRAVLRLIPDAARQKRFSYVEFSRQMLRGMALEAVRDRNARGFWVEMLGGATTDAYQRPAVELALALHDERAGTPLDRIFAAGSPITQPAIRELLLMHIADAALLRRRATDAAVPQHERELALFTLLYKEVTRGAYRDFLADLKLVPADATSEVNFYALREVEHPPLGLFAEPAAEGGDFPCPSLRDTATRLAANPGEAKARLCLADFLRNRGFDRFVLDNPPPADQLGGTPSRFPGGNFSRLELYRAIIADPKAPGADKAYALYRAVNCYATAGNNSCGGADVPIAQRAAWFRRLKKDYPGSSWAQSLKYYW